MLRVGSRGSNVAQLQRALAAHGFSAGSADGIFGARTHAAVRAYQRSRGLAADGIVGPQTGSRLFHSRNADLWEGAGGGRRPSSGRRPSAVRPGQTAGPTGGSNSAKLRYAAQRARALGLTITSTTGGRHAPRSYHYSGRAIDVAGSPSAMRQFYREMARTRPTELFHDPMGGIKHGRNIGAIGGHGTHVHIAY